MDLQDQIAVLYDTYSGDVYRYLYSMCRDAQTAQDLLQTTFLKAMGGIAAFRGECTVKTWIFTIARREYFRWYKKNPPALPLDETLPAPETQGEGQREQAETVLAYLRRLDEPHRTLMTLRLCGGLSFREIGAMLGKTEVWARVTFMRDKRKLLEDLKEELQ